MIYFYISTAIFIGGMFIVYWLHNQYRLDIVVEPALPPHDAPLISVCVPARNEERNIRACVESILAQDYTNIEVIVLDDRSTDATPEILRQFMARDDSLQVIHGTDLPAGWAGKPHALFMRIHFFHPRLFPHAMLKPSKPKRTCSRS
jgi:chlorobactene glucosyltransferase